MPKITDQVEQIGSRIISCDKHCQGVLCSQIDGDYPRAFFLDPRGSPEVEVLIVGKNPGQASPLEKEFYKVLGEKNDDNRASYVDCETVWRAIARVHQYFLRPKHLVDQLGLDEKGLLWAEAVFCEKSSTTLGIPAQTFENCRERYLQEIIETLVPAGKHIVCLGGEAFMSVKRAVGQHNRWKVIGVHHPTGRSSFAKYFAKEGKKLADRPLKRRVREDFLKLEKQSIYVHWFKPP
jgi:uracil-DNA glycosylase